VTSVVSGGPAQSAGIRAEDILVTLDGAPVQSIGDLQRLLTGERVGRRLVVGLVRGGDLLDLPLVPREL
jgi:S1-C subfamily serine protease